MSIPFDRLEATAWMFTAALGTAMGVRLLTVLSSETLGVAADRFDAPPSASGPTDPVTPHQALGQHRQEQLLGLATDDAGAEHPGAAPSSTALIYPQLYVNVGPERSVVFVNGVRVGQTPFIGEVGCRTGDLVRVDVDPPSGVPQRFTGRCEGTVLSVKKDE
jgi:hypothetical protein